MKAKIQDSWQYKARAERAETALEAEKKAHKEFLNQKDGEVSELKEKLVEAKNRAISAENREMEVRRDRQAAEKEVRRLQIVLEHLKPQGKEEDKGLKR